MCPKTRRNWLRLPIGSRPDGLSKVFRLRFCSRLMPPTNFLGDYGRQRQRAVVVDAGVRGPPDGNTRAATVECADLARAFVFNDIFNDFDQQCYEQDFDVAVDPVRRSLGDVRNFLTCFCLFRTAPTVLLSMMTAIAICRSDFGGRGVCAATVECATYGFGSAIIVSEYIILYSISTCIATQFSLKSIKCLILHKVHEEEISTSPWRPSMSSTRTPPERANSRPAGPR